MGHGFQHQQNGPLSGSQLRSSSSRCNSGRHCRPARRRWRSRCLAVAHSRIGASTDPSGRDQSQMARLGKNMAERSVQAPQRGAMTPKLPGPQPAQALRAGDLAPGLRLVGGTGSGNGDDSGCPRWPSSVNRVGSVAGGVAMIASSRGVRQVGQARAGRHVLHDADGGG